MSEYTAANETAVTTPASTDLLGLTLASNAGLRKMTLAQLATYLAGTPAAVAATLPMLDAEQYIIQAADATADNNTGLDTAVAAPVFTTSTNGALTITTGGVYMFQASYLLTNTGTTSHTWATTFAGTATFNAAGTSYAVVGNSGTTANTPATGGLAGFFTGATMTTGVVATAASTSATEQVMAQLWGTISCLAGGTLIPQLKASARPGASGTPGVVRKAGSYFRIWQVPTLGAQGAWS